MAAGATGDKICCSRFDAVYDVPWTRRPLDITAQLRAARAIRAQLVAGGHDIVHVHTPIAALMTRAAIATIPWEFRPVIIYTAHGFHFHRGGAPVSNFVFRRAEALAARWTDFLVTINQADYDAARGFGTISASNVRYMPGIGLSTQHFKPTPELLSHAASMRRDLCGTADALLFTVVGEFTRNKRQADVVQALAVMSRPSVHLAFAGVGPVQADVERAAVNLGVRENVHFLGLVPDVRPLLLASSAMLLVSGREGLPRSIMEAMSLGVPVIGTRIRGIEDLLENGNGILVDVGDVAGIASAMNRLAEEPEIAEALGARGQERVKQFDVSEMLPMHESLYNEAMVLRRNRQKRARSAG